MTAQPEPIRRSDLPPIRPPESEIFTWFPHPDGGGDMVPGQRQRGVQVRRCVTYSGWEPVRPDHWADEPGEREVRAAEDSANQPLHRALLARLEAEQAKAVRNAPLCRGEEFRLINDGMAAGLRIAIGHTVAVFEGAEAAAAYMWDRDDQPAAGVAAPATPSELRGRAVLFVTVDAPDDAHAVRWAGILRDLVHAEHGATMRLHTAIELDTPTNRLDIPAGDAEEAAAAVVRVRAECDAIESEVCGQHDEEDDGMREAVRRIRVALVAPPAERPAA